MKKVSNPTMKGKIKKNGPRKRKANDDGELTLDEIVKQTILTVRLAKGWTQSELVTSFLERAGRQVTQAYISQIETGTRRVSFRQFESFAMALELTPTQLLEKALELKTKTLQSNKHTLDKLHTDVQARLLKSRAK